MTTDQRLERLERQNRHLKRAVIGMAAAGLSLLVMGQTLPPKVHDLVKAKEFRVIGKDGRKMLTIGSSRHSGWISVNGKNGRVAAIGGTRSGNGSVATYNSKGKKLVELGTTKGGIKGGNGLVATHSWNGKMLTFIGGSRSGNGFVTTYNSQGKKLVDLGTTRGGRGGDGAVTTHSSKGKKLVELGTTKGGIGLIVQFNRAGRVRKRWPFK